MFITYPQNSQHQLHPGMRDPFAAVDDLFSHLLKN